jgi:O2-independent ubiquinone biosynthesis protein UbiU
VWRQAIDAVAAAPGRFRVEPRGTAALGPLAEGQQHTLGAYDRPWR